MRLHDLGPKPGSSKKEKRIGRGIGSGHGKTSTKGHKGGLARSGGGGKGPGFEGGQMPITRRIPKRGFKNPFRQTVSAVNLDRLNSFSEKTAVTPEVLKEAGIIRRSTDPVKILGQGDLKKPLVIRAHKISRSAAEKIKKAGGKFEAIQAPSKAKRPAAPAK